MQVVISVVKIRASGIACVAKLKTTKHVPQARDAAEGQIWEQGCALICRAGSVPQMAVYEGPKSTVTRANCRFDELPALLCLRLSRRGVFVGCEA